MGSQVIVFSNMFIMFLNIRGSVFPLYDLHSLVFVFQSNIFETLRSSVALCCHLLELVREHECRRYPFSCFPGCSKHSSIHLGYQVFADTVGAVPANLFLDGVLVDFLVYPSCFPAWYYLSAI